MIGFNGGLIGAARETSFNQSVPGVWTPQEQLKAKRASSWPIISDDPYYANVSLLLRGNGTNGSTTIIDDSFSPKTVTAVGNAQISTAQSKYGGSSLYFDGNTSYLTVPWEVFPEGTEDFTIEYWLYEGGGPDTSYGILGNRVGAGDNLMIYRGYPQAGYYFLFNDTAIQLGATSSRLTSQWVYHAITRESNTFRFFINGVAVSTQTHSDSLAKSYNSGYIGAVDTSGTRELEQSYIDDLRITKGVARYTSNFTPPGAL